MGVLSDLVPRAQPALLGDGCAAAATAGATWEFAFTDVLDDAGDAIDLTGVTGVCEVLTAVGGSVVVSLTFAGTVDGTFTLSKDEAATVGLATGTTESRYKWRCTLNDGTDTIQAWGPANSPFIIRKGA